MKFNAHSTGVDSLPINSFFSNVQCQMTRASGGSCVNGLISLQLIYDITHFLRMYIHRPLLGSACLFTQITHHHQKPKCNYQNTKIFHQAHFTWLIVWKRWKANFLAQRDKKRMYFCCWRIFVERRLLSTKIRLLFSIVTK